MGDAFGFKLSTRPAHVSQRLLPEAPWYWSDDTAMASSLAAVLLSRGCVDQDELFAQFVARYTKDPRRGYGSGMKRLLERTHPSQWREATPKLFGGSGSFGNGAAMRAPVLGAFLSADLDDVVEQATLSAQVTHSHEEGIAGAVAVACASALKSRAPDISAADLLSQVARLTPKGQVRSGLEQSLEFDAQEVDAAAARLGNGERISAADTVPFCVWWAAHAPDSFEEAMWTLVAVGGDEDTNCAIVGGILGAAGLVIPDQWLHAVEAQPALQLLDHPGAM